MVLEIISVYFRRNKRLIFDNFNLKLRKSQIIILIGDNGVGKSSLLDIAAGILRPEKGTSGQGRLGQYLQLKMQYSGKA